MQLQEIRQRLVERAAALGLAADSEEALLDALIEREVPPTQPPSDAECRRFYEEHARLFLSGERIVADHILFAVTGPVVPAALRRRVDEILVRLSDDPEQFAAYATRFSNCPSAARQGALGALMRGDVVPEFWQALSAFKGTGLLPEPVESRYGLHIVCVRDRSAGTQRAYEAVRSSIEERLAYQRLRARLLDYANALPPPARASA